METKDLMDLTESEARFICKIYNEPFLEYHTVKDYPSWIQLNIAVAITTTSTLENSKDDSRITIYYDGNITLHRNNGNWGGSRYEQINPLIGIEYLRLLGYKFKYNIPDDIKSEFLKLERLSKLKQLNNENL